MASNVLTTRLRRAVAVQRPLFKANGVEQALRQVLPRSMLRRAMQVPRTGSSLIEVIAEQQQFDSWLLLQEVAARLGVAALKTLQPPSTALIQRSKISLDSLMRAEAVPQNAPGSQGLYRLAVADTIHVDQHAFAQRGVEVVLAPSREIQRIWQLYAVGAELTSVTTVNYPSAERVVIELAAQAYKANAELLLIGRGAPDRYQFQTREHHFMGSLHAGVYSALLEALLRRQTIELPPDQERSYPISLSLLQEEGGLTVICRCGLPACAERSRSLEVQGILESSVQVDFETAPGVVAEANGMCARTLLLIDDDVTFARLLSDMLKRRGYQVVTRYSQESALEWLEQHHQHCGIALSDVHLEDQPAGSCIGEIRGRYPGLPIIALSADGSAQNYAFLLHIGADAFVAKQTEAVVLLAWLEKYMPNKLAGTADTAPGFQSPEAAAVEEGYKLASRLGNQTESEAQS